jgi:hypothetical protein
VCKLRPYREVEALRWKHRVEFFDVPVYGRIAILTNQSSAVSLCTSQFKYPLKYSTAFIQTSPHSFKIQFRVICQAVTPLFKPSHYIKVPSHTQAVVSQVQVQVLGSGLRYPRLAFSYIIFFH